MVEAPHVIEQLARYEQTRSRREPVFLDELRDWEPGQVVVASGERRLSRCHEAHVGREVVSVALGKLVQGDREPTFSDGLIGVEKDEYVPRGVLDARVPGCVGGLYISFEVERHVVVVGGILVGDLRCVVRGAVVDHEDLGGRRRVREQGVEGVAEPIGVVVDWDYEGGGHLNGYNFIRMRLFDNRVMLRCLQVVDL